MAVPILQGEITGEWTYSDTAKPETKADLLRLWDDTTEDINRLWPDIPPHRFQEVDTAFGQWTMPGYAMILYGIDNEIHHRGQGYVYLRSLGMLVHLRAQIHDLLRLDLETFRDAVARLPSNTGNDATVE